MRVTLVLFLFSLLTSVFGSLYGANSAVVNLTPSNFRDTVLLSDSVWMVEFYAPWCGHCKSLQPHWEQAAQSQKGIVNLGAVNCDDQSNQQLCAQYEIKGFPTIKLFPGKYVVKANGQVEKKPVDYQGPRTAAGIAKFGLNFLSSYVTSVTQKNEESFLSSELKKVILFTDKPATPALYKALSCDFKDRLAFGEVKKSEKSIIEKHGITAFPTLIVLDGDKTTKYDGKLQHTTIHAFLSKLAPAKSTPGGGKSASPEPEKKAAPAAYTVKEIKTQEEFDEACETPICIIAFMEKDAETGQYPENYLTALKEAQEKFPKHYQVVWMDGPSHVDFMKAFDVNTDYYPSALLLSKKKKVFSPFMGAFTGGGLAEFMQARLRSSKRYASIAEIPSL